MKDDNVKKYVVVVTVTDPVTGQVVHTHKMPCLSTFDARQLLGNVREGVELMTPFLPGLAAAAYEVEEAVHLTPSGLAALQDALPPERRAAAWWAQALQQGRE